MTDSRNFPSTFTTSERSEIYYFFEIFRASSQEQTQSAGNAAQIPDVNDRHSEFDMSHAFASDTIIRYFNAAMFADNSFEFWSGAFIFSAFAFVAASWTEDFLAEQAVSFRAQCSVIYRLRFLHLPVRNFFYAFWSCEFDSHSDNFFSWHLGIDLFFTH